jgi:hypothetical protein
VSPVCHVRNSTGTSRRASSVAPQTDCSIERETQLLQMLAQMQQQNQRLLDIPRSVPAPSPPGPRAPGVDVTPRGEMRRRIVVLLQEHPEGLSPAQTRRLLEIDKDLGSTMKAMVRDGVLRRVETGRYVVRANCG